MTDVDPYAAPTEAKAMQGTAKDIDGVNIRSYYARSQGDCYELQVIRVNPAGAVLSTQSLLEIHDSGVIEIYGTPVNFQGALVGQTIVFDGTRFSPGAASAPFGAVTAESTFGASSASGAATTAARSDHTHGNPVHDAAAHSGIPLSALGVPTAMIQFNQQQLTNLPIPMGGTDAATKSYVDTLDQGRTFKQPVRVATTANINTNSAPATVDGVTLNQGDRVLLKNQTAASQNGVYIWPAAAGVVSARSVDTDTGTEMLGACFAVLEGTTQADTVWMCTTASPINLGVTSLAFILVGPPPQPTSGGVGFAGGTIPTSGSLALVTINFTAVPYARLITCSAMLMFTGSTSASVYQVSGTHIGGGTWFARGPAQGTTGVTLSLNALTNTLAANTAGSISFAASFAGGTSATATASSDARFSRADWIAIPVGSPI